jgi:hypothetical protein
MSFGGSRIDAAIASELLRVVEPLAIEAAQQVELMQMDALNEQRQIVELECNEPSTKQHSPSGATPRAGLPARLEIAGAPKSEALPPDLAKLAENLHAAWNAPASLCACVINWSARSSSILLQTLTMLLATSC